MARVNFEEQQGFSELLFDTLYGLILYFNMDMFSAVTSVSELILFIAGMVIVIHWWLESKAIFDTYGDEIAHTITHTVVGTAMIILLQLFVLAIQEMELSLAVYYLLGVFLVDIAWCAMFLYIGKWKTKDKLRIFLMEMELSRNLKLDIMGFNLLILLLLIAPILDTMWFVILFTVIYSVYFIFTYIYKIIHVPLF